MKEIPESEVERSPFSVYHVHTDRDAKGPFQYRVPMEKRGGAHVCLECKGIYFEPT